MIEITVEISSTIEVGGDPDAVTGFSYDSEISGYIAGGNSEVINGDSLREIIQKLQGQINYLKANTSAI